jgi:Zn finger protein HypA/HybF involved in hydrogenase expression
MKALSTTWFITKSKETHKNRFIYLLSDYKGKRSKVTITCRSHGVFTTDPRTHYTSPSGGCKECGKISEKRAKQQVGNAQYRPNLGSFKSMCNKSKYLDDTFITKANNVHNYKYTYILPVNFSNIEKDKFTITCAEHGKFTQVVKNHLQGQGCPSCGMNLRSKEFLQNLLYKRTPETTIASNKQFYKRKEIVTFTCPVHGDQETKVYNLLRGGGCPKCSSPCGFQSDKPGYLYYVSVLSGTAYKIGITNKKNVLKRFSSTDRDVVEVLHVWKFPNGEDCRQKEKQILSKYKAYKYTGTSLLESGNTELFYKDILNLDIANI